MGIEPMCEALQALFFADVCPGQPLQSSSRVAAWSEK